MPGNVVRNDALVEQYRCPEGIGSADVSERVDALRLEKYLSNGSARGTGPGDTSLVRTAYYLVRPLLPVRVRKHLQRLQLAGWENIPFPRWPVDRTVEETVEAELAAVLHSGSVNSVPFIWFWPHGAPSCAIMTHDVETAQGRDFCGRLMDINDSVAIKSSFQLIPEKRYEVADSFLDSLRDRGFEINVHDLNHDGHLFRDRKEFLQRAARITQHQERFRASGFRSAVLYRNLDWYDALTFRYDMSVPNVAHLDPQRGGCCTVRPYFIGDVLELPLTTTQDYSLFHILNDYSIDLWKRQIALITEKHGVISFNVHPDYIIDTRAQQVYRMLLDELARMRADGKIWTALPGAVDRWWRERARMTLARRGDRWEIQGPGSERARVAHATLDGNRVVYQLEAAAATHAA